MAGPSSTATSTYPVSTLAPPFKPVDENRQMQAGVCHGWMGARFVRASQHLVMSQHAIVDSFLFSSFGFLCLSESYGVKRMHTARLLRDLAQGRALVGANGVSLS